MEGERVVQDALANAGAGWRGFSKASTKGPNLLYWAPKCAVTLFDQGLVSGSNFLLGVLLARWLGPEQYGVYAITFSLFLLVAQIYQALVMDPMGALQPALYPKSRRSYLGSVLQIHLIAGIVFALIAAAASRLILSTNAAYLSGAFIGLVPALPCVLLFWLCRSATYLTASPEVAAGASAIYCLVMIAGMAAAIAKGVLSPQIAFYMMSVAAVAATMFLVANLKPSMALKEQPTAPEVWRNHWNYGRWLLGTSLVTWLQLSGLVLLSGYVLGVKEAGVLNALAQLHLPAAHIIMAISRLTLPHFSAMHATRGGFVVHSAINRLLRVTVSAGVLYWISIAIFHRQLFHILYGGKFDAFSHLAPWYTFMIVLSAATFPYELGLRASRAPSSQFAALFVSSIVTFVIGVPAIALYGLPGVIGTIMSRDLLLLVLMARRCSRRLQQAEMRNDLSVTSSSAAS